MSKKVQQKMTMDADLFQEYLNQLADRYTAAELVEEMGLDVWDILERFREELERGLCRPDRYDTE